AGVPNRAAVPERACLSHPRRHQRDHEGADCPRPRQAGQLMQAAAMPRVFDGLRVIDAANYVAGPAAAVMLADFGADVIKIEPPGGGDLFRLVPRMPNLPQSEHNWAWTLAAR